MKILYLCTADPQPPHSDYPRVLEFFDVLPEHLHPYNGRNHTENVMLFADRYTGPIMPELYDVAIAFLSERFLTDEKTLQFLKEAYSCFPDLIGIDLSDALTPELKMIARSYSKKLFSAMDARIFLENNFPDPDALSKQEAEELKISIETDGYQYLDDTIADLNEKVKSNKKLAYLCYWGSFLALIGMLVFSIFCYESVQATIGEHALLTVESLANQRFTYLVVNDEYREKVDVKYLFYYCYKLDEYCLKCLNQGNFASVDMAKLNQFRFSLPSLDEQRRIVAILDRFDTLCNDITSGLPAEIEARQKQYEYYRDKLLSFKELKGA